MVTCVDLTPGSIIFLSFLYWSLFGWSMITSAAQREVLLRCPLSPYQQLLTDLVTSSLVDEEGEVCKAKGINNTVMELRSICNHPYIRWAGLLVVRFRASFNRTRQIWIQQRGADSCCSISQASMVHG